MQIILNLSPYIINYLNSFADTNASQVTEFIVRQYIDAMRRAQPVEEPVVNNRVQRQRVKPTSVKPKKDRIVSRHKKIMPTR